MSNQHIIKGRHKREIDCKRPPIEIKGYCHKTVPCFGHRLYYVINMPKLNLSCYKNLTETIRLIL